VAGRDQRRWWLLRVEGPYMVLDIESIRFTESSELEVVAEQCNEKQEVVGD
jgi:hypothetical protein